MKQVLIKRGAAVVEDVPAPGPADGFLLIAVRASCISIGTEMSGIAASSVPLWKRALDQPEKVKRVFETAQERGVMTALGAVRDRLDNGTPTGYSAAGVVLHSGKGCEPFLPGDRVACAGAQYAHHAEVIKVPKNLCVRVQDNVSMEEASTVTLGAIALQGVRRANPTLGENFMVIGLGVLGQLTVQLLKANGCNVVGMDPDPTRIRTARDFGMDSVVDISDSKPQDQIERLFGGYGADGVIITAASSSEEVISTAFKCSRKKGRVVLVGDVALNLRRDDFYKKELDFFISTSYGPGRYDSAYEEKGVDYPIGYVRWTENRNMQSYLAQIAAGKVHVKPLISATFPIDEATAAYEALKDPTNRPLMVLLEYPGSHEGTRRTLVEPRSLVSDRTKLRVAVIGAGGFARGMHLPNLREMSHEFEVRAIVSGTGANAKAVAREFRAAYASTDYVEVLKDPEVDVVLIATRHDTHANLTLEALHNNKHVLVEKPLAVNREELLALQGYFDAAHGTSTPILMTGFNRRFAPVMLKARELMRARSGPAIINYRMNAGYISTDHWVHGPEGGGRNIGEACHIYDLFTFLTDARVKAVSAVPIGANSGRYSPLDNFVATVSFDDGSIASLTYTAMGDPGYPKEMMELFVDGRVFVMENFQTIATYGSKDVKASSRTPDKGLKDEWKVFARAVRTGEWLVPLWQQFQAMRIAFDVEQYLTGAKG